MTWGRYCLVPLEENSSGFSSVLGINPRALCVSGKCSAIESHLQLQAEPFTTGCIAKALLHSWCLHLVPTQASDLCKIPEFSSSSEPGSVDGDTVGGSGPVAVDVKPLLGSAV